MTHRPIFLGFVLATAWICLEAQSHAEPILGSQVSGGLFFGNDAPNWFDSANARVPSGFLNSSGPPNVTIAAASIEFGFRDALPNPMNRNTADFTGTQLIVIDTIQGTSARFRMVFTDAAFLGATLTELSDTFPNGGVNGILSGDTITLTWAGTGGVPAFTPFTKGTPFTVVFDLTPAPSASPPTGAADIASAPEPTSLLLFGGVVLGAAAVLRKRIRRKSIVHFDQ
jgi:hypothetical protein